MDATAGSNKIYPRIGQANGFGDAVAMSFGSETSDSIATSAGAAASKWIKVDIAGTTYKILLYADS